MPPKLVATHKYCRPVLADGQIKFGVWRKDPSTQKTRYVGRHDTIEKCCKALKEEFPAEAADFTPEKLLRVKPTVSTRVQLGNLGMEARPIQRMEKVMYKGITPERRSNGKVVYKVHAKYNTPQWRYESQIDAARAIARAEECSLKDLQLSKAKLPTLAAQLQQDIHGKAMALYSGKRPGDVESLDRHAKRSKTWHALERYPGIIPSFLIAKVEVDRVDVVRSADEVWKETEESCAKWRENEERIHYKLLVLGAQKISRHRWSKAEERSIGRNNFHWMNYHTMLVHLDILSTTKTTGHKTKPLVFQNSGTSYYVQPWNAKIKSKLQNHIAWGRSCMKLCDSLPKDGDDFLHCVAAIDKGLQKLVGALKDEGYSRKWLKRAWMRFLLIGYDIKINFRGMSVRKFSACWPDEHNLLTKLLSDDEKNLHANLASTVGEGLDRLGYKDSADLLSMHACLVDDWDAQTVLRQKGAEWLVRNWTTLKKRLAAWRQRDKIWPHPGLFFLYCWDLE